MSSPTLERSYDAAVAVTEGRPRLRTFMRPPAAKPWEFAGVINARQHHDDLKAWCEKPGLVRITDHLGRTFEVVITDFEPTDRQPTARNAWRMRYSVKTLLLRRLA